MERTVNSFPIQKIPFSQKSEEWKKTCVDYIIGQSQLSNGSSIPTDEEMQTYYDLYNSVYSEKDLKYVTNPFNQDDGFPAVAQDYNIIRPKIDLLIGEETKDHLILKYVGLVMQLQVRCRKKLNKCCLIMFKHLLWLRWVLKNRLGMRKHYLLVKYKPQSKYRNTLLRIIKM